jgi:hypothetical protein
MFRFLLPFGGFCCMGLLFSPVGKTDGHRVRWKKKARSGGLSLCCCIAATLRAYRQEL